MSNSVVLERLPATAGTQQSTTYRLHLRQRVFIFLTRYGLIFSANLMVMLIGAVNYNNSLAYALIFLLSGLFLVAMLHTYSNLRGLIISASPAEAVFAGQQASFPLVFDNRQGNFRLAIDLQTQVRTKKRFRIKTIYTFAGISITNADGTLVNAYSGKHVYGNSHGFIGGWDWSSHLIDCTVIAEDNGMQRDGWYSKARDPYDL